MSDMVLDGLEWLDEQMTAHNATAASYYRPTGDSPISIMATMGDHQREVETFGGSGASMGYSLISADFNAAELVDGGVAFLPEVGAKLVFGSDTYVLRAPAEGAPHYERLDPKGIRVRVWLHKGTKVET
jgi:hypothetical protein